MARVFHRSTNPLARVSIFGFAFLLAGLSSVTITIGRSSYLTYVGVAQPQSTARTGLDLSHVGPARLWQKHVERSESRLCPDALRLLGPTRLQQLEFEMDALRTHQSDLDSAIYPASHLGPKQ